MIDTNQVWDVPQAVEYVNRFAEIKPWFIEEPTTPDEYVLSLYLSPTFVLLFLPVANCTTLLTRSQQYHRSCQHSAQTREPCTGEHAHNLMVFKQLRQADAIDVIQIDTCLLTGASEVLAVLRMAAKFGKPVCPPPVVWD